MLLFLGTKKPALGGFFLTRILQHHLLGSAGTKALVEAIDTAANVDVFLLACVEWVTC